MMNLLLASHCPPARGRNPARWRRLGVAAMAGAAVLLAACGRVEPAAEPIRSVRTMTVGAQGGASQREYAGEIRALTESRLSFRVGGKLLARPVNAGDRVKAGQRLADLDASDLRLGQEAARAALHAAQVNYDQNAADFKRFTELRAQGFISTADLERRESALKAARAELDQARAQASVQSNQAAYAGLVADAPGVITEVYVDPGTVVAAGTPVLRLAHDGPRDVVFAVPEDQVAAFRALRGRAGALRVTLWSGGTPLQATVREVAGAADPVTRTFQVKASLPVGDAELGQTATVHVELAPPDGALRLPLSAVFEQQGRSQVWLVDKASMKVRAQAVQVQRPEGDSLLVAGGLKAGDVVVTAGTHVLQPGETVRFFDEAAGR